MTWASWLWVLEAYTIRQRPGAPPGPLPQLDPGKFMSESRIKMKLWRIFWSRNGPESHPAHIFITRLSVQHDTSAPETHRLINYLTWIHWGSFRLVTTLFPDIVRLVQQKLASVKHGNNHHPRTMLAKLLVQLASPIRYAAYLQEYFL